MATSARPTTIHHLSNSESIRRFRALQQMWPRYKIADREHRCLDMSECQFIGTGGHEIAIFTFARHQRLAALLGVDRFTIWLSAGAHWNDRWHDANGQPNREVPAIGILRGVHDRAGLVEPFRLLAIVSCSNGPFVFDKLSSSVTALGYDVQENSIHGNPHTCWVQASVDDVLTAAGNAATVSCPPMTPISPFMGAAVSLSIDEALQCVEEGLKKHEEYVISDCELRGVGPYIIYAYTYDVILEAARMKGEARFPVKIGYTQATDDPTNSDGRIGTWRAFAQVDFTEKIRILGLVRCSSGRAAETWVHRQIAQYRITAPAREWFLSNKAEIDDLMSCVWQA